MGYVYTPEEYERGKIPCDSSFPEAIEMLKSGLTDFYKNGIVLAANINGSALSEAGSPGSDIDTVVVIPDVESVHFLNLLKRQIKHSTFVPVEWVPVKLSLAEAGDHDLDYYFLEYVKNLCKEGIVGRDPIPMIKPAKSWAEPNMEVKKRHENQLKTFCKTRANTEYGEKYFELLERIMRWPIYSAIDALRIIYGSYPSMNNKPLSKVACCELYEKEFSSKIPEQALFDLDLVMGMRNRYREFLKEREKTESYVELLDDVDGTLPSAYRFMEANFELVKKLPE